MKTTDPVLLELWATKDRNAARFGSIERYVRHLQSLPALAPLDDPLARAATVAVVPAKPSKRKAASSRKQRADA